MKIRDILIDQFKSQFHDDMELFEMANLPTSMTGVDGIIYISSMQGKHGARIKWYPQSPKSKRDPCLAVTISSNPSVYILGGMKIIGNIDTTLKQWVVLNHVALLDFWKNGFKWDVNQVNSFIAGLQKV